MNRFRRFAGFLLFPALILSAALFHGCNSTETDLDGPGGRWESKFIRYEPGDTTPANVRITLDLTRDKKCAYSAYWNNRYVNGFQGGWSLQGDSLYLTATVCYKGDTLGIQFVNDCDEDLPTRVLAMNWDGAVISKGRDSTRIQFYRLTEY